MATVMMEEHTKELKDYFDTFRRYRFQIIIISVALFLISLIVALLWPPTYRSMATILIEEQEVPSDLIRSTVTSFATQRIQIISQTVMTRANLMQIMEKFNLYKDRRGRVPTEEILEGMRKDIKLEMINSNVIDPRSGSPTMATIAFSVGFEGSNPEITQKVASELTSLYLSENLKTRTEKATETVDFLDAESKKLNQHIAEVEAQLAMFKQKNAESLPDMRTFNIQLTERTEKELTDLDAQLRMIEDKKFNLEGQLAQINPMGSMMNDSGEKVLDPETRLKMLRSEYISALSRYSPDHPDVVRLQREIGGLEKQTGSVSSSSEQAKELSRLRAELAAAREKYSKDHPDVIRLTKMVSSLEANLKAETEVPEAAVAKAKPENPAYIMVKAQLDGINNDKQSLFVKRGALKEKLTDYEKRMTQIPEVERKYLTLHRDYQNSIIRYQELKAKQMQAEVGQQLEKERKGERFSLIDPAQLPEQPIKPNRPAIIILGFLLSIASGFGYVTVIETMDTSVRGTYGVIVALNAPPLSVIPYKRNSEDLRRLEKRKKTAIFAFTGGIVLLILFIHLFWTPLDVLWFKGLRKVNNAIAS